MKSYLSWLAIVSAVAAIFLWFFLLKRGNSQTSRSRDEAIALVSQSDPNVGYEKIKEVGCAACHVIPGVASPRGRVGPDLTNFREQQTIAGVLPNSSENLVKWIQNPRLVDSKTAMPDLDLSEKDARDIAAYLYAPR
jgi:cytochrome c2